MNVVDIIGVVSFIHLNKLCILARVAEDTKLILGMLGRGPDY